MHVIRAVFDGRDIKPIDPVKAKKVTEVLVIFPDDTRKTSPSEARRYLRGVARGERLTEKLLKSRSEDLLLERNR